MHPELIFSSDEFEKPTSGPNHLADEAPEPSFERARVLVVDDQRLIADTLSEILVDAGFNAVAAYDGWQALEIASRFHPDWLLSDVLMPQMNGVTLAIEIRARHPATEILLLSGQAGITEILEEARNQGYDFELIAKPIHPRDLLARLTQR